MDSSERGGEAVAGCCTLAGSSWHCSHPELDLGDQIAAVAAADLEVVQWKAVEEAGSFLAVVAFAVSVAHQCFQAPCKTSFDPPQVVTCVGEAS